MLCDENNIHPLHGDIGMYFKNTYVSRVVNGVTEIMYVEEVTSSGDSRKLSGCSLIGQTYRKGAEDTTQETWSAADLSGNNTQCGYRLLGSKPVYFSVQSENRSNKKGLDPKKILIDGARSAVGWSSYLAIFLNEPFKGKFDEELCLHRGKLLWKGETIGTVQDGAVTLSKAYEDLEEYVCKVLGRSFQVKSLLVQDEE